MHPCNYFKATGPVKKSPPFLSDTVEIVIPVEPCKEYIFDMKIISPQNKEIEETQGSSIDFGCVTLINKNNKLSRLQIDLKLNGVILVVFG